GGDNQAEVSPAAAVGVAAGVGGIDFAELRRQLSMEAVLAELGWLTRMKGGPAQRRGPCPGHARQQEGDRSFSVNLSKGLFRCFTKKCGDQGNVLDRFCAVRQVPLYEAALQLARRFGIEVKAPAGTEKRNP